MAEPPPPPIISISDPTRPGEPIDVMVSGDERAPWKPGRRTWLLVALSVLAAATYAGVGKLRDEHRKDRLAASQVRLGVTLSQLGDDVDDPPAGTVRIGIRNDGPTAVDVVSYQVLFPGYAKQSPHVHLLLGQIVAVYVPDTATCSTALLTDTPKGLQVTVKDGRGHTATHLVGLGAEGLQALVGSAQDRCRYLPPENALQLYDAGWDPRGKDVALDLNLGNRGRLPLTVTRIDAPPGMRFSPAPAVPLALTPNPRDVEQPRQLTLRMRITDCYVYLAQDGTNPVSADITVHFHGPDGVDQTAAYAASFSVDGVEQSLSDYAVTACTTASATRG